MSRFVAAWNDLGEALVGPLARMSVELAILAAVVVAVVGLLRVRSPALRHLFWCLVLAKPALGLAVASPVTLYFFLRTAAPAPSAAAAASPGMAPVGAALTELAGPASAGPAARPAAGEAAAGARLRVGGAAAGVWLAGVFVLGLRLALGWTCVRSLRRRATPVTDAAPLGVLADAARAMGVRQGVGLAVTDVGSGPVLAGLGRPVVLMPRRLMHDLAPPAWRLLLAHELAHVRRRDNLVLLLQRLAETFFFFHPAVWLGGWMVRREAEAACDDLVVARCGDAAAYADSLTRVAEAGPGEGRRLLVSTLAAAESAFARRVRRLLRGRPARPAPAAGVVPAVALVLVAWLGLPTAAPPRAAAPGAAPVSNPRTKETPVDAAASTSHRAVKREGDRVWIEGVPALGWGRGRDCTYAGALEAALAATDHPAAYHEILGWSGLAFRVRWFKPRAGDGACPSSPVGEFPEEIEATQRATGWRIRGVARMDRESDPHMEDYRADLVAALEAGRPVLAYVKHLNLGVVYGFEAGGETLLCREYFTGDRDGGTLRLPVTVLGPMLLFLEGWAEPPTRRASFRETLRIAARNWRREEAHPGPKGAYLHGEAALAYWSDLIGRADALADDTRAHVFFVSWWNFQGLCDARRAAVRFLREGAGLLAGDAGAALERATTLYQQEADLLDAAMRGKDAFLGPWTGKTAADWSAGVRQREREVLAECRRLETAAVAELAKALAAEAAGPGAG